MTDTTERPEDRFAGASASIDLNELAPELLARANATQHGHAQRTLYKHDGFTAALFAFRSGGSLPEHQANGSVTIHVLTGQLTVTTPTEPRPLGAGHLLRLEPGTRHAVEAASEAVMLLHIGRCG